MSDNVRAYTIRICDDCIALKGAQCNNPECVFCRRTMDEVSEYLDVLLIVPIVDGERLVDCATPEESIAAPAPADLNVGFAWAAEFRRGTPESIFVIEKHGESDYDAFRLQPDARCGCRTERGLLLRLCLDEVIGRLAMMLVGKAAGAKSPEAQRAWEERFRAPAHVARNHEEAV